MNNVLKIVLLIVGIALIGYGGYLLITPAFSFDAGPLKVETQGDKTQPLAMIGFGVLALIAGLAFGKR